MIDDALEVGLVVDVEPIPKVATNHHAAESQVLHLPGVVERKAAEALRR